MESEERLLTAAAEVMVAEGFAATTFEKIGQRAGYSHGLVTQRFGSKDGLILALIDYLSGQMDARYEDLLKHAATPVDELAGYLDVLISQVLEDPLAEAYFVMMSAAIANRLPQKDVFLASHERMRVRFADSIRRAQDAGLMSPELDPDATALAFGCVQLGFAVQLLLNSDLDPSPIATTIKQAMTALSQK
ncbi:TetR/AcrR family transcriptional regulator [Sphingobium fuliginis]|uniref:TetR/AcrR family transcriptional regulator n=2 Tax=Sphingobium TaxID=165695 RepID=UPI001C3F99A7|nr:TetR/AcrR family transcriptional regulator [Sphingobium fuliginis]